MSRLVKVQPKGLTARSAAAGDGSTPAKDYLERMAKYVPAEIIIAYTSINGVLLTLPENIKFWVLVLFTAALWVLTPFYFKWISKPDEEPSMKKHQWVSFIAFIIWAYSISGDKGVFGEAGLKIFYQEVATSVMIIFSLISGAIIPKK